MKRVIIVISVILLLLLGFSVVGYPFISNLLTNVNLGGEVQDYLRSASSMSTDEYDSELERAVEYNKGLLGNFNVGDPFSNEVDTDDDYYSLLNVGNSDAMACIEIPVLNIKYPIYHGTSDKVLQKGIGHLVNSSLPVGGKGVHSVLTGHTGLSTSKFFTDIDKMEIGDVFYIYVFNQTLAYSVDSIKVVKPLDVSNLEVNPDEDYVTLVTCTPYGKNTHRLLVRGKRIPYDTAVEQTENTRIAQSTYNNEYISAIIIGSSICGGVLSVYVIIKLIIFIRRKRKANEQKDI